MKEKQPRAKRASSPHSPSPIPHPRTSAKQLAANRANALKSTGPRTPEGKARSAQNAVKHGFTGSTFAVVRFEELEELGNLKADAVACYRPVNAQEMFAVERIALAQFKILRGHRLESGFLTTVFDSVLDPNGLPWRPLSPDMVENNHPVTRTQNRNYGVAQGLCNQIERHAEPFALLLRYQAQAEREYRRAIEDFERLKALRNEMPNEPIWQEKIEENHELATLEELNVRLEPGQTYNPTTHPESEEPALAPTGTAPGPNPDGVPRPTAG